jgi:glyoxylase-like metal-dependent hydrolase (beta-lactamase superfamily II)
MLSLPPVKRFESNTGVRIYRIACQVFEHLTARVYLLLGAGPPTLIDTGSSTEKSNAQILEGFESVRREFGEDIRVENLERIIITHRHIDHLGGLERLHRLSGAKVGVHPLDKIALVSGRQHNALGKRILADFFQRAGMEESKGRLLLKLGHFDEKSLEDSSVPNSVFDIEDGMELDGLKFIHTPGHSPGHLCIGIGNILFSADHILAQTIPQQWPETLGAYNGIGHYLDSLEKIKRMPGFDLALASHEQVMHHVSDRIDTIRAAHLRRLERLMEMMRRAVRPMSIKEIADELYPEVTGFRSFLAITDVAARVEYLHQRSRLAIVNLEEIAAQDQPIFRYAVGDLANLSEK